MAAFSSFFVSRTRDVTTAFEGYLRGLFQSERANLLRMSEANAVDHQAMQHMLTEGRVDWAGFGRPMAQEANALLGGPEAVLLFDESAFANKGDASAGVARPWNGRLGKVDNGQVGVFAALCQGDLATLIDTRWYVPEAWANDGPRCEKAAIPEASRGYRRKTQLALAMLETAWQREVDFGFVGVDGGYGQEPAFLRAVDRLGGRFVADVHSDQRISVQDPAPRIPTGSGRGKPPRPLKAQTAAVRVDQWAASQPADAWQRLTLRAGEKGLIQADYLHARVWVGDGHATAAHGWYLRVRRDVGAETVSHYGLSNAPADTSLPTLARVQAQRFFIEHSFREAKPECGLADYPVRRWDAWHHHMALVMLGTLLLLKQKKAGRPPWPMLSCSDLVTALAHRLPRRQMTSAELAEVITQRHRLRQKAKESHYRRATVALE